MQLANVLIYSSTAKLSSFYMILTLDVYLYRGGPYKRSLISSDFPAPKMEPQSGQTAAAVSVYWLQCGNCDAAPPTQHSPMHLYSAYSATPRHVSHENLNTSIDVANF